MNKMEETMQDPFVISTSIVIIFVIFLIYWKATKPVRKAKRFIGQREATKGSYEYGFADSSFDKKMRENGFRNGYDWCAIFAKSVIKDSLPKHKREIINKIMTPSTQQTYRNLLKASEKYDWIKIYDKPKKGAVAVWQNVNNPNYGHIGIIKQVRGRYFETIEGNVSLPDGYDGVATRLHSTIEKNRYSGKRLLNYFIKIN